MKGLAIRIPQSAICNRKGPAALPQGPFSLLMLRVRSVREHDLLRGARFAVDGNRDKVDAGGADSRLSPWSD